MLQLKVQPTSYLVLAFCLAAAAAADAGAAASAGLAAGSGAGGRLTESIRPMTLHQRGSKTQRRFSQYQLMS